MKDVAFLWAAYGVIVAGVFVLASEYCQRLSHATERTFIATLTTVLLLTTATAALLLPALDIALVASTNIPILGVRKDVVTDSKVDAIVLWIKIAYIGIYAFLAFLSIAAVPFSWVYFEEWDEESTTGDRIRTASKYTAAIIFTLLVIFILGLIIPSARLEEHPRVDFDYLKGLLASSRPVKALLFVLGIVICLGTISMIIYTATGLSVLPISLIKSKSEDLGGDTDVDLDLNRQKQRQIEIRYEGTRTQMSPEDRRALDSLHRRERILIRAQRIKKDGQSRMEKIARPIHIFAGLVLLVFSILLLETLLSTLIRQLISSDACGPRCGFLSTLPSSLLLNPLDLIMVDTGYFGSFILQAVISLVLVLMTLRGCQALGIRFLWMSLYSIAANSTVPQALLCTGVALLFSVLGLQYTMANFVLPSYTQYGGQTYCNGTLTQCAEDASYVIQCTLTTTETHCTRSVISRILASLIANYSFGVVLFWAQFAIFGVWLFSLVVAIFRKEKRDEEIDETTRLL